MGALGDGISSGIRRVRSGGGSRKTTKLSTKKWKKFQNSFGKNRGRIQQSNLSKNWNKLMNKIGL